MSEQMPYPSGQQWVLRHRDHEVTVVEIGGGLRTYTIGGRRVLDGFAADEMCSGARGTTLAPWPNRLRDGHYRFAGEDHQLALSEPSHHNAIHGLVRWRPWGLVEQTANELTIDVTLLPQPGYPFFLHLTHRYRLDEGGLTISTDAHNIGDHTLPYGLGFHPYLTLESDHVDDDLLTVPAHRRLATDERGLPTSIEPVEGSRWDYRDPARIGDQVIDTAFTDLVRGPDGLASVTLAAADGTRSVSLWADATFPYLQVFTGDTLPEDLRRRGLGVEPMTCGPDAFNTGDGLLTIKPGQTVTTTWGLRTTGF